MLQIALELALHDPTYDDMALKFFEHFVWIASAMIHIGGDGEMWDEEDGFFYDVLRTARRPARAAEGAVDGGPAAAVRDDRPRRGRDARAAARARRARAGWFVEHRPELVGEHSRSAQAGSAGPAPAVARSARSGCGASSRPCSTRTSS